MRDAGPQARERAGEFWGREAGKVTKWELFHVRSCGRESATSSIRRKGRVQLSIRDWAACFGVGIYELDRKRLHRYLVNIVIEYRPEGFGPVLEIALRAAQRGRYRRRSQQQELFFRIAFRLRVFRY